MALSRLPTQNKEKYLPTQKVYTRKNIENYYISTQQEKVSEQNIISTQVSTHQMRTSKIILYLYKILHKIYENTIKRTLEEQKYYVPREVQSYMRIEIYMKEKKIEK